MSVENNNSRREEDETAMISFKKISNDTCDKKS